MGHSGAKLSIAWSTWIRVWSCGEIWPRQALSPVKFPARKWKPPLISGKSEESWFLPLINNPTKDCSHSSRRGEWWIRTLNVFLVVYWGYRIPETKRLQLMLPYSHFPPRSQTTKVFILKTRFFETFCLFSLKNQFGSWTANVTSFTNGFKATWVK